MARMSLRRIGRESYPSGLADSRFSILNRRGRLLISQSDKEEREFPTNNIQPPERRIAALLRSRYAAAMTSDVLARFPAFRPRRLRQSPALRALVAETSLRADQLVL